METRAFCSGKVLKSTTQKATLMCEKQGIKAMQSSESFMKHLKLIIILPNRSDITDKKYMIPSHTMRNYI